MLLSGFMQDHIHSHDHAFTGLNPRVREGLVMQNRRGMLKASLAGMAGLSLPQPVSYTHLTLPTILLV